MRWWADPLRTLIIVVLSLTATAFLLAGVPEASAESKVFCTIDATANYAKWTYGKMVYENFFWPADAAGHATYWATVSTPTYANWELNCALSGSLP